LGVDPDVEVDIWELSPEQGDRFLLCSDGLSNEVPPDEISRVLADTRDPKEAAEALVRRANESGGNDNITAVVLDVLVGEMSAGDGYEEAAPPTVLPAGVDVSSAGDGTALVGRSEEEAPDGAGPVPATYQVPLPRRTAPRRITVRVVLFVLVLGGLGYCTWAVVRWYVDNSYFVGLDHGQVVIYQGRTGGFLGIDPKVVDRTGITLSVVRATDFGRTQVAPKLQAGVEESSRNKAVEYVCNLPEVAPGAPSPRGVRCGPAVAPTTTIPTTAPAATSAPAPSALSARPPSPHYQKVTTESALAPRVAA
jgi:protein phosphatase